MVHTIKNDFLTVSVAEEGASFSRFWAATARNTSGKATRLTGRIGR